MLAALITCYQFALGRIDISMGLTSPNPSPGAFGSRSRSRLRFRHAAQFAHAAGQRER